MTAPVLPEDISAFIDGELPPDRAAIVQAALLHDPALAAQEAAFRHDRDRLRAALAPVAEAPLPAAWLARIEAAVSPAQQAAPDAPSNVIAFRPRPPAPTRWQMARPALRRAAPWALAACLLLALATPQIRHLVTGGPATPTGDDIVRDAASARTGTQPPREILQDAALPDGAARQAVLRDATGLRVHAPDLRRLGWSLAALKTYLGAAELLYRNQAGEDLTLYIRRSDGTARFDLLHSGKLRVCLWQDDVLGAVIMADMPAGPMMRIAAAAYNDLNS